MTDFPAFDRFCRCLNVSDHFGPKPDPDTLSPEEFEPHRQRFIAALNAAGLHDVTARELEKIAALIEQLNDLRHELTTILMAIAARRSSPDETLGEAFDEAPVELRDLIEHDLTTFWVDAAEAARRLGRPFDHFGLNAAIADAARDPDAANDPFVWIVALRAGLIEPR